MLFIYFIVLKKLKTVTKQMKKKKHWLAVGIPDRERAITRFSKWFFSGQFIEKNRREERYRRDDSEFECLIRK